MWDSAAAVPASRQRPIMDPQLEGERIMHWFETTVSPTELWGHLGPVALSTSVSLLASCESRRLPLIAAELDRYGLAFWVQRKKMIVGLHLDR